MILTKEQADAIVKYFGNFMSDLAKVYGIDITNLDVSYNFNCDDYADQPLDSPLRADPKQPLQCGGDRSDNARDCPPFDDSQPPESFCDGYADQPLPQDFSVGKFFKIGDVVHLKAGSNVEMNVVCAEEDGCVSVEHFDDTGSLRTNCFPAACLVLSERFTEEDFSE